jgi:hypothetical protein
VRAEPNAASSPASASATLDHLLRNRFPDVVTLSTCGSGTDTLATSYAVERDLPLVPYPLDGERDRTDQLAAERRNAGLVAEADVAVVVWDRHDRDLVDLIGRCKWKGIPVRVLVHGRLDETTATEPSPPPRGVLPD